jgi:hypothetical protein
VLRPTSGEDSHLLSAPTDLGEDQPVTHVGCKGPQNTNTKHNHASEQMDLLRYPAGSLRMCLIKEYSGLAVSLMMCCTLLCACTGLVLGGLHVCLAGVFPKVSRTLTTSGNPLQAPGGRSTLWHPVSCLQWVEGDKVCRHRSSSWGAWERVQAV